MPDGALGLEDAQLRADGRVARRAWKQFHDLAGGRASQPIEHVHDLPLTPREAASRVPDSFAVPFEVFDMLFL